METTLAQKRRWAKRLARCIADMPSDVVIYAQPGAIDVTYSDTVGNDEFFAGDAARQAMIVDHESIYTIRNFSIYANSEAH